MNPIDLVKWLAGRGLDAVVADEVVHAGGYDFVIVDPPDFTSFARIPRLDETISTVGLNTVICWRPPRKQWCCLSRTDLGSGLRVGYRDWFGVSLADLMGCSQSG